MAGSPEVGLPKPAEIAETQEQREVRQYLETKKERIQVEFDPSDPEHYRDLFNNLEAAAEDIQKVEQELQMTSGDPTDEATPSSRNQELQVQVWTQQTVQLLQDKDTRNEFLANLSLDPQSRFAVNHIVGELDPTELSEGTRGVSYVYKILHKALNNGINEPKELLEVLTEDEFGDLAVVNSLLHKKLTKALADAAEEANSPDREIQKFLAQRNKEAKDQSRSQSYIMEEFEKTFIGSDEENKAAIEFHTAIESGNVHTFVTYYKNLVAKQREVIEKVYRRENQLAVDDIIPAEVQIEQEIQAGKEATIEIQKTILFMVNKIFENTLGQAPEKSFTDTAREQGGYMADPLRVYNETLLNKLIVLFNGAKKYSGGDFNTSFYGYKKETREYVDPNTGTIKETEVPVAELTGIDIVKWMQSLKQVATIERGALEFQFNLGYIIRHPGAPDKGGVMGQMMNFAKTLETETLDALYILPYNEIIQAGQMGIEQQYEMMFSRYDWKKNAKIWEEMLADIPPPENRAQSQLLEYFGKGDKQIPTWAITRGLYHGRLMAFGKEFMFQLLSSYADPVFTRKGDPTFVGEGPMAGNSVFDIWEAYKRWGTGADQYTVGVGDMPAYTQPDEWRPRDYRKAVRDKLWESSQENGHMAFFEHDAYKDTTPWFVRHNFTKMYGVDGYGGWRVKYAYMQWLQDPEQNLVDENSLGFNMGINDAKVLVKGWKSVENIGVNVVKNYSENFLINDETFKVVDGEFQHIAKYEEFFKYLYRRYFKEGSGAAMYEGIHTDGEFWQMIRNEIFTTNDKHISNGVRTDRMNRHIYNAMTVLLYERQPLKFVTIEKERSSQNGITLRKELIGKFIRKKGEHAGDPDVLGEWNTTGRSDDDVLRTEWDQSLSDIGFVEQALRIEATEQMRSRVMRTPDTKNRLGILFREGDINASDTSDIEYMVNRQTIDRILREHYDDAPDRDARIDRAIKLYEAINERVVIKPEEGKLEKNWRKKFITKNGVTTPNPDYNMKLYNEAVNERLQKRLNWFADTWRQGEFGRQFTSDTAGQFLNRSATGEEVVARTAEACMVISEATKNYMTGSGVESMLDGISSVVRNGRSGWEAAYKGLVYVYSEAKKEDKDHAKALVKDLLHMFLQAVRIDDRADAAWGSGQAAFAFAKEKTSLAHDKVDEGPAYDLTKRDMYDFVRQFTEKGILTQYTKEADKRYKEVPKNAVEKLLGLLKGDATTTKMVRDYSSEVSGEAVRKLHKSGKWELVKKYGIPAAGILLVALVALIVKKAMDDEEEG